MPGMALLYPDKWEPVHDDIVSCNAARYLSRHMTVPYPAIHFGTELGAYPV